MNLSRREPILSPMFLWRHLGACCTRLLIIMDKLSHTALDTTYLESEYQGYLDMMEAQTDAIYELASQARLKGIDFKTEVEIPRAKDLASRTVRLLDGYLRPDPEKSPPTKDCLP